jgi:phosphonate transport system permease protein
MAVEVVRLPPRPLPVSGRKAVAILIALATVWAIWILRVSPADLVPTRGGLDVAVAFLSRALTPALTYESAVPPGTAPLLVKALLAVNTTVAFAAAAMSVALVGGIALGFLASSAWWSGDPAGGARGWAKLARSVGPALYVATRLVIAVLRSIHELLWAVLLLAALGVSHLAAVVAIALPYAGVLAKVFSEMVDEAPREAASALRDAGASPLQVYFFGLIPRALPDMVAYAFYRFECALRSSVIIGFFGFPTLGYYIGASFENLLYGEVWTYLYVLFALIALMDWWSVALRRRFVA